VTGANIVIRDATASDAEPIAVLLGELGYLAEPASIPPRLEQLRSSGRAIALVAERGQAVVGVVAAHAYSSLHVDRYIGWLTTLVVNTKERRQGIGRRLVQAAEEWVREMGCIRVSVSTRSDRIEAHEFYDGLGYRHTGMRYTKPLGDT
jgi:GNAT superfamily N-acetyltransferase